MTPSPWPLSYDITGGNVGVCGGKPYLHRVARLSTLSCTSGFLDRLSFFRDCRTPSGLQRIRRSAVTPSASARTHAPSARADTHTPTLTRARARTHTPTQPAYVDAHTHPANVHAHTHLCSSVMLFSSTVSSSSCGHKGAHSRI